MGGNWKLLLGNAGEEALFREPTGTNYDEDGRTQFVIMDWICDIIDVALGPNPFEYCWLLRQVIMKLSTTPNPNNKALSKTIWSSDFGETIPISQNYLPVADWSKYDSNVIQLYNLHDDPLETQNVALENRELVEAMTARLVEKVRNGPGQHLSIQKQFFGTAIKIFILISFAVIFLLVLGLYACFKRRPRGAAGVPRQAIGHGRNEGAVVDHRQGDANDACRARRGRAPGSPVDTWHVHGLAMLLPAAPARRLRECPRET